MARSGHLNISGLWVSGYDVLFFWIRPICRRCPQLVLRSILWNIDREYLSEETLLRIAARNLVLSLLLRFFVFLMITLPLSSLTRGRFYPQQSSSGQAVVAGVVPSPPRHVLSFFVAHRVQHSHCTSIFIEECS